MARSRMIQRKKVVYRKYCKPELLKKICIYMNAKFIKYKYYHGLQLETLIKALTVKYIDVVVNWN